MADVPGTLTNLKDMIHFYLSYHKDRTNRLMHIISLPFLTTTFLIFLCYVRLPLLPDLAFLVTVGYCGYLIFLDAKVGFVFAPYAGLLYFLSLVIVNVAPPVVVLPITIMLHLACWTAQIVGHVQCESNRPAMFTSLTHSVLAAPVVVYLETLFSLGLMKETQERLDADHGLQLDRAQSTEPATTIYGTAQA